MPLTIITNIPDGHEGTPERDNPEIFYDHRGKFDGCVQAARGVAALTVPDSGSFCQRLSANDGTPLEPLNIRSVAIPHPEGSILAVHSPEYLEGLREASERVRQIRLEGNSTYLDQKFGREAAIAPGTFSAAVSAVAACVECVELAVKDKGNPTFALVWPPGHHAEGPGQDGSKDLAMGFCYLSNAAIAALHARDVAQRVDPSRPNRVLVIDFDNHSGNGTTKALANQDNTMVVDFRYRSPWDERQGRYVDFRWDFDHETITVARQYPYDRHDRVLNTVPHPAAEAPNILTLDFWGKATTEEDQRRPETRSTEGASYPEEVLRRFIDEALPGIQKFKPDVIILSVGVDSAENDPIGGLGFSPGAYYALVRGLRLSFPDAAHVGILEGGYNPDNWTMCLQPVFVAYHERPDDTKARANLFRQVAAEFIPDGSLKEHWVKERRGPQALRAFVNESDRNTENSPLVQASFGAR